MEESLINTAGPTVQEQLQAAIKDCQEALHEDPENLEARRALTRLYTMWGEDLLAGANPLSGAAIPHDMLDRICGIWERGISVRGSMAEDTDSVILFLKLANLQRILGRLSEASDCFNRAALHIKKVEGKHAPLAISLVQHWLADNAHQRQTCDLMVAKLYINYGLSILCDPQTFEGEVTKLEAPIKAFEQAFLLQPTNDTKDFIDAYYYCGHTHFFLGSIDKCIPLIKHAHLLQEKKSKHHSISDLGIRFIAQRTATLSGVGQLMNENEIFFRSGVLGWRPQYRGVILAPKEKVANEAALKYWQEHICVVRDPALLKRFEPLQEHLEFDAFWLTLPNGKLEYVWNGLMALESEWIQQHRKPPLKLLDRHKKDGWELLESKGVQKGAWFVTLHVREQTKEVNGVKVKTYNSHRDAEISTYRAAIMEITSRGGWVIRMGDPSMSPLPPLDRVIDYAHSDIKSDWMDMFLIAESAFFIGTSSGLNGVPMSFGVPSLLTNISPMNGLALGKDDLSLPKLLRSKSSTSLLSFSESLQAPFNTLFHTGGYDKAGVTVEQNTEEEILEAVREMLDRREGKHAYSEDDNELQSRFKKIALGALPCELNGRIAKSFLHRYRDLLR